MRKAAAFAAVFAVACALGAGALADSGPPTVTTDPTATTPAPDVLPEGVTAPDVLPEGVTIGGVPVGGLAPADAYNLVREAFTQPLTLVFAGHRLSVPPTDLGAVGYAKRAVAAAGGVPPETEIPLKVAVRPGPVRAHLRRLARKLNREPVESTLVLRAGRPFVSKDRPGIALDVERSLTAITAELESGRRETIRLPGTARPAAVTRRGFGPVIVIHRGLNRLQLYNGMRFLKSFGVATGQSQYPTPLGPFQIVVKWKNPWWYPPASPWAVGEKPTPPGPGNPLGTRWMGLSAPGVGIHGTPNSGSIGYSLSHGCIRMLIPQAEWLFEHVQVGTPVFIVAS